MCARCDSTVRTLRYSCPAISEFVWPRAISRRISTSRSVRSSGGPAGSGGAAAMRAPSCGVRKVPPLAGARPGRPGSSAAGPHELLVGGLLEDVAARPGLEGLARERGVLLHREDDDLRAGRLLAED